MAPPSLAGAASLAALRSGGTGAAEAAEALEAVVAEVKTAAEGAPEGDLEARISGAISALEVGVPIAPSEVVERASEEVATEGAGSA